MTLGIYYLEIVVVRVLGHAPVEEGPCEIINGVLFVLNGFGHNFSVEVIVKAVVQVTFDGQWLVQELFVKVLLRRLAKQNTLAIVCNN